MASGAFWLIEAALTAGAVASLLYGFDIESATLLVGTAAVLLPLRRKFYRSAKLMRGVLSPGWFVLVAGLVLSAAALFFFMHEAMPHSNSLWTEFPGATNTPRALRAGLVASAILLVATLWLALKPARAHTRLPDAPALEKAREIVLARNAPEACLALTGDKALFFDHAKTAFIMYAVQAPTLLDAGAFTSVAGTVATVAI